MIILRTLVIQGLMTSN